MIHFISGRPGGGKSLFTLRKVVDELVLTNRVIVTNLAIKLDELNAYMQDHYPDKTIDLRARIQLLDDSRETGRFWLFRPGYTMRDLSAEEEKAGKRLDFQRCYRWLNPPPSDAVNVFIPEMSQAALDAVVKEGLMEVKHAHELPSVLYIIDELHEFFNARQWMNTGRSALFYLSQHRKLGDDVLCVTQSINNVDKQFRSVAQDFTYIRNLYREKLGVFRSFPVFTRQTYLTPVTGSAGEKPMESGVFRLDVSGLCKCYDTAKGVGILGKSADTKQERRGVPITVLFVALAVGLFALWRIPSLIGSAILHVSGVKTTMTNRAPASFVPLSNAVSSLSATNSLGPASFMTNTPAFAGLPARPPVAVRVRDSEVLEESADVRLTGFSLDRGLLRVYLSDGSSYTQFDRELQFVSPKMVVINGKVYRFRVASLAKPEADRSVNLPVKLSFAGR